MKVEFLEKTQEYLDNSAQVAAKAAGVAVDSAKAVKGAAVRTYDAAGSVVSLTGRQIRRKPVVSVLAAIGAGFLLGLLIGRKTKG
jgi:ElaB/YqjD/DUF883 family membrane-anchored ribosome-binding protein